MDEVLDEPHLIMSRCGVLWVVEEGEYVVGWPMPFPCGPTGAVDKVLLAIS